MLTVTKSRVQSRENVNWVISSGFIEIISQTSNVIAEKHTKDSPRMYSKMLLQLRLTICILSSPFLSQCYPIRTAAAHLIFTMRYRSICVIWCNTTFIHCTLTILTMGNTESTSLLKCVDKNGQLDQERYFHYRRQVDNVTQEHHKAAAAVSDVNSKKIRTPRHRSCKCKERGKVCDNGMFVFIFCC